MRPTSCSFSTQFVNQFRRSPSDLPGLSCCHRPVFSATCSPNSPRKSPNEPGKHTKEIAIKYITWINEYKKTSETRKRVQVTPGRISITLHHHCGGLINSRGCSLLCDLTIPGGSISLGPSAHYMAGYEPVGIHYGSGVGQESHEWNE